ncbi:hypothetical protein ACLB2K_058485 [Fragaria x ananassa]
MTKPSAASTRLLARLLDDLRFGLDCISPASGFQPRLGSDGHRLPTFPLRYRQNPTFVVDVSHINTISEGVRTVLFLHATFALNSVCHTWGHQAWETGDLSTNNWLIALLALGEGWHNNHHAFQHSARHGLEWWQIDVTWYVIRFLELVGLATEVKLPTETQKKQRALSNRMIHEKKAAAA